MDPLCEKIQQKLTAGEELEDKEKVHLQNCADCADYGLLLREVTAMNVSSVAPPTVLDEQVRMYAVDHIPTGKRLLFFPKIAALAAALVLLGMIGFQLSRPSTPSSSVVAGKKVTPAPLSDTELQQLLVNLESQDTVAPAPNSAATQERNWDDDDLDLQLSQMEAELQFYQLSTDEGDGNAML